MKKNNDKDENSLSGWVSGALQKDDYISKIQQAGLVSIIAEDKVISNTQYSGLPFESTKIETTKQAD
jgi:hypothetical protein